MVGSRGTKEKQINTVDNAIQERKNKMLAAEAVPTVIRTKKGMIDTKKGSETVKPKNKYDERINILVNMLNIDDLSKKQKSNVILNYFKKNYND